MLWRVRERNVIRGVAEKRFLKLSSDKEIKDAKKRDEVFTDRRLFGVERDAFEIHLIDEEFDAKNMWERFLDKIRCDFFGSKGDNFYVDLNDILELCIEKGYITSKKEAGEERLRVTEKGRAFASRFYWIKSFYNSVHIQHAITAMIQYGAPLLALWILSHFFNVNIGPK